VFLGGAINFMAIQNFAVFYSNLESINIEILPLFVFAVVLLLITPIILSLILTKYHPEKQIVPPIYIQIVSLSLLFISLSIQPQFSDGGTLFVRTFYAILGGFFQDGVAIGILGRTAHRDDLLIFSFDVNTDVLHLRSILTREKYRHNLNLGKKIEERNQNEILRSPKDSKYRTVIEMTETPPNVSHVNIAVFERGSYAIKMTEKIEEFSHRQIAYFREILERHSIQVNDAPLTEAESFLCSTLDEMKGYSIQIERMSRYGWLKILAIISSASLSIIGYWVQLFSLGEMLTIFISTIIFGIFELYKKR